MAEKICVSGLYAYAPSERAPDFVKGSISIKPDALIQWLEQNRQYVNDKGYLRIDLQSQKQDPKKWSASVNTYGLNQQQQSTLDDTPF